MAFVLSAAMFPSASFAQTLVVKASSVHAAVGEPITVRVEARLGVSARLLEQTAHARDSLPDGVSVVSVDSLSRLSEGDFAGQMRFVFFRPGSTSVPSLALAYVPAAGAPADTLRSLPVAIDIVASLPPGNQALRDIKDLAPLENHRFAPGVPAIALLAMALLILYGVVRRARRRGEHAAPITGPPDHARNSYESARARLAEVEAQRWPARGAVVQHYEQVAGVLRLYLEDAFALCATELTTSELVAALPPELRADGQATECQTLLDEADLVKFARLRPNESAARNFLAAAVRLLDRWNHTPQRASVSASAPEDVRARADEQR
ncbi:MAG: hypothetical protein ABI446_02310 [Gemmatimonadaceae bacterium]